MEQWAVIFCLGWDLLFTVSSPRLEFGFVYLFTESSQQISSRSYWEKAFGATLIFLSGFLCRHYAIAKHVCAEIIQAGQQEIVAMDSEKEKHKN